MQNTVKFRKQALSCIYPSKYKPPHPPPKKKLVTQKNPPLNRPSKYKPTRGLYLEIALKYRVKKSKDGKDRSILDKFFFAILLAEKKSRSIKPKKDWTSLVNKGCFTWSKSEIFLRHQRW